MENRQCDQKRCLARRAAWLSTLALLAAALFFASDETSRVLQWNTLKLVMGALLIGTLWGVPLALVGARTSARGGGLALLLVMSLLFVPLPLHTAGWQAALGIDGWLTPYLAGSHWLSGWVGAIWIHGIAATAWIAAILAAGLSVTRPELEEDALLRHSVFRVLGRVTLPRVFRFLVAAWILITLSITGEIAVTDVFQIRTFGEEVYTNLSLGQEALWLKSATSWGLVGLLAIIAPLMFVQDQLIEPSPRAQPLSKLPIYRGRSWATLWMWLSVCILVGVPLANLVVKAGLTHERISVGWHTTWSAEKVARGVARSFWSGGSDGFSAQRMWFWTILTAGLAALASSCCAIVLTWWSLRLRVARYFSLMLVVVLAAIPGPVLGLIVIRMLNCAELPWLLDLYDHSILAPWLVQTARVLPLAILFWLPAMQSVPRDLRDDAFLRGDSHGRQLLSVAIPYQKWRVAFSLLMFLPLAAGELAATNLVAPPGFVTVTRKIFEMIHFGIDDRLASLALASWLLLMGALFALSFTFRVKRR